MEVTRTIFTSSPSLPPRTLLKNPPSASVSLPHEKATPTVTSVPTTSIARHFPTSVLLQEQRDEYRPLPLHLPKEDRTSQGILDRRHMETPTSLNEEADIADSDQYLKDFERQLLHSPGLWYLLPSLHTLENTSITTHTNKVIDVKPHDVIALAMKALSASKEAASLADDSNVFGVDCVEPEEPDSDSDSSGPASSANFLLEEKAVRSTRLLERRSKKRRASKTKVAEHVNHNSRKPDVQRKTSEGIDPNDPLRLFLGGPETRQLLTAKEEIELIVQIKDLMRLEEVKTKIQSQFNREASVVEWAEAVGLSCQALKAQIHSGNRSREKLIYANFRMVVHVAKQYQSRGLILQDLLQEGSKGLMRSVEKFKPQAGCRFATYAYWWIRQSIRKAIFQHSRTVRLPENVYSNLSKVLEANRLYIQEKHRHPSKEELAARVGFTVEKLEQLVLATRMPLSMQQPVWSDQDTTFQEITADYEIESPRVGAEKQLMRQHMRNLLCIVLSSRERRIICLRYGIDGDGKQKSLSEIGEVFKLSKERVRQLESRALYKLKQSLSTHGLDAYADLLV